MKAREGTGDTARGRPGSRLDPLLLCALAVGALVRIPFVAPQSFPLNDGGLFYLMVQELQRAHYALPVWTTYNGAAIPFAYPPLGLYLAGLLADLGPWSLLDLLRWLPLAASIGTIAAFYALARALLPSRGTAGLAAMVFALLPGSYTWQIMGGGLTRSLGLLFATLTVHRAHLLYTRRARRDLLLAGLLAAGTVLSHLAMALAAAAGCALLFLVYARNRAGVIRSCAVAGATVVLSAPWWATVVLRHGVAPFLAAGTSPEPAYVGLTLLLTLQLTAEPFFPLLGGLALLGALLCLARRRYLLPTWLAALFLLDPRTAGTTASLPLALLAGTALGDGLLPAAAQAKAPRALYWAAPAFALFFAVCSGFLGVEPLLAGLSPEEREAMAWVRSETPPGSIFLVVTGDSLWGGDRSSEWFPVLAERVSAGTVQGTEWLPGFAARTHRYTALQQCAGHGVACLEAWAADAGVSYTHVYVAGRPPVSRAADGLPCCTELEQSLRGDPRYQAVYEGAGATVFAREPVARTDGGNGDG